MRGAGPRPSRLKADDSVHPAAILTLAGTLLLGQMASASPYAWPQDGPTGPCGFSCGSVRAVVRVSPGPTASAAGNAACVVARVPWRRRDKDFASKQLVVVPAALCSGGPCPTTLAVRNLVRLNITRKEGVFAFEPSHGPGDYHVYWLSYNFGKSRDHY